VLCRWSDPWKDRDFQSVSCVQVFEIVCEAVGIGIGIASSSVGFLYHQSFIRKSCSVVYIPRHCWQSRLQLPHPSYIICRESVASKWCRWHTATSHWISWHVCMSYSARRGQAVTTATYLAAFDLMSRTGTWLPWVVGIVVFLSPSMNTTISPIFRIHCYLYGNLFFDGMTYEIVTALLNSGNKSPVTSKLELWQGPAIWNSGQKRSKSHFLSIQPLIVVVCQSDVPLYNTLWSTVVWYRAVW
jgi:hypothetical protein